MSGHRGSHMAQDTRQWLLPIALVAFVPLVALVLLVPSWSGVGVDSTLHHTRIVAAAAATSSWESTALILPLESQETSKRVIEQVLDYRAVARDVFKPAGYSVCYPIGGDTSAPRCWPQLHKSVDCKALFQKYLHVLETSKPVFPTPKELPADKKEEFLLQGYSHLKPWYVPQPNYQPDAPVPVWEADFVASLVNVVKARPHSFGNYMDHVLNIYQALDCHPVTGQGGAVFGSDSPWLEAVLFASGAQHLTTIEYRKTLTKAPNHEVIVPADWARGWLDGSRAKVDFAWSFSSWEHDGLARYGDPLDPWGDVGAVQRASCYVKPGGLLYVGVPSSSVDQIEYNAHRIYGPVRLPLLTAGWEVLGVYEAKWKKGTCGTETCNGVFKQWERIAPLGNSGMQPVYVLKNLRTTPCMAREIGQH